MTTVYVVTTGVYSDYHIEGVCSTKELAEETVQLTGGTIEEYELDLILARPKDYLPYVVVMEPNGDCVVNRRRHADLESLLERSWSACQYRAGFRHRDKNVVVFYVWARNEDHAVKIAAEKRTYLQTTGMWTGNGLKLEEGYNDD